MDWHVASLGKYLNKVFMVVFWCLFFFFTENKGMLQEFNGVVRYVYLAKKQISMGLVT